MHQISSIPINICDSSPTSSHPVTHSKYKSSIIAGSNREPLWSTLPAPIVPIVQKTVPLSPEMRYMDRFILTSESESFIKDEGERASLVLEPNVLYDSEVTSVEIHESECTDIDNMFINNSIQIQEEIIDRRTSRSLTSKSSKNRSKIDKEKQPQPSPTLSPNLVGFIQNLKYSHLPDKITEQKRARTQTTTEIPNPFVMTPKQTFTRINRPKLTAVTPFRVNRKKTISIFQLETQDPSPYSEDPNELKYQEEIEEEMGGSDIWHQDSNSIEAKFIDEEGSPSPYSYDKITEGSEHFFQFNVSNL